MIDRKTEQLHKPLFGFTLPTMPCLSTFSALVPLEADQTSTSEPV